MKQDLGSLKQKVLELTTLLRFFDNMQVYLLAGYELSYCWKLVSQETSVFGEGETHPENPFTEEIAKVLNAHWSDDVRMWLELLFQAYKEGAPVLPVTEGLVNYFQIKLDWMENQHFKVVERKVQWVLMAVLLPCSLFIIAWTMLSGFLWV